MLSDVNDDRTEFVMQVINTLERTAQTKPLASIVLLTFNQEHFVEDALASLLNQDYENLEIVISDDCSRDGTWDHIQKILNSYSGFKKIIAVRNPINLGIVRNYESAFQKTTGDLIFMAAGDDISLPNRCSRSIEFWLSCDHNYDLVAADAIDMSYEGERLRIKENDPLEEWTSQRWFKRRPFFFGASQMVTRRLLNLAPLHHNLPYEDQCLVFRSLLMGGAIRLPEPLVCHRRGGMTQSIGFKIQFGQGRSQISKDMLGELAELDQFLSDATALNKRSEVEGAVRQRMIYCQTIIELFQGPISILAAKKFWQNPLVSANFKLRYLRYYFFYPVLAIAHYVRDIVRMVRSLMMHGRPNK
jgi:glycosyltransferase involved in cell wall biosynthesis